MITVYTFPSILALALKLTIFWFGRHSMKTASIWLWLFFTGLFGMNLSELATFYYVTQPQAGFFWLSTYYIAAQLAFFSLFALALDNAHKLYKYTVYLLLVAFTGVALPSIIPGAGLAGVESIGYSITRIAGPYYFIVQLGILVPLLAAMLISIYFSIRATSQNSKRRSQILLISCLPIFVSVIVIMALMQVGYKINASVVLSLMITFTLMILIYTEHKERQYKFMSLIPATREHRFIKRLSHVITDPTTTLQSGRECIEQEMIREALIIADGNKVRAASMLGISRQTLQRKLDSNNSPG